MKHINIITREKDRALKEIQKSLFSERCVFTTYRSKSKDSLYIRVFRTQPILQIRISDHAGNIDDVYVHNHGVRRVREFIQKSIWVKINKVLRTIFNE